MSEIANAIKAGAKTGLLNARVSFPAIVKSVDVSTQTLQAEIAIQQVIDDKDVNFPLLVDVPFVIPTCQGFSITMPVQADDEVLILFSDRCIDGWHFKGGVQPQLVHRVHDMSDGFALIGINSQPNVISSYSSTDLEIRDANRNIYIRMHSGGIESTDLDITGNLTVSGDVDVTGDVNAANVNATGDVVAGAISLKLHTHTGVTTGPGVTGLPQ